MRDEIKDNPRLFVAVLITAVVAAVILCIFILILVWSPKKVSEVTNNDITHQQDNLKLGKYKTVYTDEKMVIEDYCEEILNSFNSSDVNLINNIVLPEYLTFLNVDKSGLISALKSKGVLGKMLKFSSYKVATHLKYGKIFEVTITSYDNSYNDKIWIIEKSPNDYKVSFDGFIGLDNHVKTMTVQGLKLEINQVKEFITSTSIKLTLTNVAGHNIIINPDNNYENIYLQLTTGTEIRLNSTWLSGETKELTNGYVINLNTEFVTSGLTAGLAKNIVIKNVYDSISKETKDIVFPIN